MAKDCRYGRACFVLECGGGQAQHVITSIGQAFELRFKEYLKKTPQPAGGYITPCPVPAVNPTPVHPATSNMNAAGAAAQPASVQYTTLNNRSDCVCWCEENFRYANIEVLCF